MDGPLVMSTCKTNLGLNPFLGSRIIEIFDISRQDKNKS